MAQKCPWNTSSLAALAAAVAYLALLGCQFSSNDDDPVDDAAGAGADLPSPIEVRPRGNDASPANAPSGGPNAPASAAAEASADGPIAGAQASTPDESAAASSDAPDDSASPVAAEAFEACTSNGGSYGDNCDSIYVTVKRTSPARCVQLTIDNCGGYNRQGLAVDVPLSWRLASGSISSNVDQCALGVFYPDRPGVRDASGAISWNESTRLPSEIVMELTLEPSISATDTTSVHIATSAPLTPVPCVD
jgi:hypothetical protein